MSSTPTEPTTPDPDDALEPAGVLLEETELSEEELADLEAFATGQGLGGALGVEVLGTFALVLAGVGVGMYASVTGIGPLGTALAFGLALFALIAAFGRVSGGHFNPAVTLGAALAGRTSWGKVLPYWLAQVVGGALATTVLFVVAKSNPQLPAESIQQLFQGVSNTFGDTSPLQFGLVGALLLEVVVTGVFVAIILGTTARDAPPSLAAPAIGLTLAFGLLILTPVTNGSMNPARSLASALFAGSGPLGQVWLFWVAPLVGAAIAGLLYGLFGPAADEDDEIEILAVERAED